jgi:hypothetical protein
LAQNLHESAGACCSSSREAGLPTRPSASLLLSSSVVSQLAFVGFVGFEGAGSVERGSAGSSADCSWTILSLASLTAAHTSWGLSSSPPPSGPAASSGGVGTRLGLAFLSFPGFATVHPHRRIDQRVSSRGGSDPGGMQHQREGIHIKGACRTFTALHTSLGRGPCELVHGYW